MQTRNLSTIGSWFVGLGPDYESSTLIVRINSFWRRRRRRRRIPERLVAFTIGSDDDLDCFDLQRGRENGAAYPVVHWGPGMHVVTSYPSFIQYGKLPQRVGGCVVT